MPITYRTGTYPNLTISRIEHVGCVIKKTTEDFRAMSDVYTTADYADVWIPEEQTVKHIRVNINYMGCDEHGHIVEDINNGEYAEDYQIWLLIQEDIQREADERRRKEYERKELLRRAEEAKEKCLEVVKGSHVKVCKGRKVAKGTEGTVFWIRDTHFGTKIGLKDADGTAHWTYAHNVVAIIDGVKYDEWGNIRSIPQEGWVAKWDAMYTRRKAAYEAKLVERHNDSLMQQLR